jgi:hypothetical protein
MGSFGLGCLGRFLLPVWCGRQRSMLAGLMKSCGVFGSVRAAVILPSFSSVVITADCLLNSALVVRPCMVTMSPSIRG